MSFRRSKERELLEKFLLEMAVDKTIPYGGVAEAAKRAGFNPSNANKIVRYLGLRTGDRPLATPILSADISKESAIDKERERLVSQETLRQIRELHSSEAKRRAYIDAIKESLRPVEPTPLRPHPLEHLGEELPKHKWVLVFSDWHVGQKTEQQATGGIYEQNTVITRWQLDKIVDAIYSIFSVESQAQHIEEIMILFLGDLVEGDSMRPAQLRQIDMMVVQQVQEVFNLCEYLIRQVLALPGVQRVKVHFVGGNHDRTTTRPGLAGLGENSFVDTWAWLLGHQLEKFFENEPRLRIKTWDTFYGYDWFAGKRFVMEHGATIRTSSGSYGGVPFYPITAAAGKYSDMLDGADFVVLGHFHRAAVLPMRQDGWLVMNGALPATTEYVQSTMKGIRVPLQWLLVMHDEHGLVSSMPLYAKPETLLEPGAAWELAKVRDTELWR